jgi:hypothetical protein
MQLPAKSVMLTPNVEIYIQTRGQSWLTETPNALQLIPAAVMRLA